jgi:hypothetical protein
MKNRALPEHSAESKPGRHTALPAPNRPKLPLSLHISFPIRPIMINCNYQFDTTPHSDPSLSTMPLQRCKYPYLPRAQAPSLPGNTLLTLAPVSTTCPVQARHRPAGSAEARSYLAGGMR